MIRSRAAKVGTIVVTTLALAFLAVVTSSSHEADDDEELPSKVGPGPKASEPVAMPTGTVGLQIALGLKDTAPTEWEGAIKVSEGTVVGLEVVRSGPAAKIDGTRFHVETAKNKKAAVNKKKQQLAKKKQAQGPVVGPVLLANVDAPAGATVTVTTGKGEIQFKLSDLPPYQRRLFLDGEAAVQRQAAAVRLTGNRAEDDFPVSASAADGSIWLASTEYRPDQPSPLPTVDPKDFDKLLVPRNNGDRIVLRRFDGKAWQPAIAVTGRGRDLYRPTVAVDGQGNVLVAWAENVDGDWEIFRRTYTPPKTGDGEGTWDGTNPVRVTRLPGSDFHVVAATDSRGVVWLAWQGWRDGNYEIMASAQQEGHAWATPKVVSDSPANDWSPAIAADGQGNVFVAWDTYDKRNYDVRLRNLAKDESPIRVADSARFEGRPHLACGKDGRLWIGYEEGDEQWGKDYAHAGDVTNVGIPRNPGFALYVNRTVKVKCLDGGKLMQLSGSLDSAFNGVNERNKSVPRIAVDNGGGVWLFFRHHPENGGEVWISSLTRYDGRAWSAPRVLPVSSNLIDNRPALAPIAEGILAVWSTDHRTNTGTQGRGQDDLYAARLGSEGSTEREPALRADDPAPRAEVANVHPTEPEDIARIRAYRVESEGKSLRLLRGEFHRHTEYTSHNDQDGLFEDAWRYALDAADHDWMGDGDHDNGFGHEYMWWLIQKVTEIHHHAPRFVSAMTYERSVVYPNGHRNVMMPKRGIRPLPRGVLAGTPQTGAPDTKQLYEYLKHFGGICAAHTSATQMGTDWRDNDPVVEPVVEIFQGHRHNYEHFGAPKSATEATQIGGYEPAGFVWNALEKGYKLGFQSSSDHVSTHMSYAIVLTDDSSRQGIIDAFKKRHCYAANDNIILVVRSGEHLMGDTFDTKERPTIDIVAHGTDAIKKVHVIRDNKYVFSTEPNQKSIKLRYADDDARPGQSHYYYVRIEQADRDLAWSSPMWISYKE